MPPASLEDAQILQSTLQFVSNLLQKVERGEIADALWMVVMDSLQSNLLRILSGEATVEPSDRSTPSKSDTVSLEHKILQYVYSFLRVFPDPHLVRLLRETSIIEVVKTSTVKCFSTQLSTVQDRENRVLCLRCLLKLVTLPSLSTVIRSQTIAEVLAVLTQTLGCLQQNFSNIDAFSHQDRLVYRLIALSLRHLSRTLAEPSNGTMNGSGWVWGDHWLFEGSLDWLLVLLSDDEIKMQKIALGVISNLILVRESYRFIMGKIPNFLDMAFAYALDVEQEEGMRKESLMVINNFFNRFCHDHGIVAGEKQLAVVGDKVKQEDPTSREGDKSKQESISRVLEVFENCLFFDRIMDVLDNRFFLLGYPLALVEMLLNLALIVPDYLRQKFQEHNLNVHLIRLFVRKSDIDKLLDSDPFNTKSVPSFDRFRRKQFHEIHGNELLMAQYYLTVIYRLLGKNNAEFRGHLVSNTNFERRVVGLLNSCIVRWEQDTAETQRLRRQLFLNSCSLLSEYFADDLEQSRNLLAQALSDEFLSHFFHFASMILQKEQANMSLIPMISLCCKILTVSSCVSSVKSGLDVAFAQKLLDDELLNSVFTRGFIRFYREFMEQRKTDDVEIALGMGLVTSTSQMVFSFGVTRTVLDKLEFVPLLLGLLSKRVRNFFVPDSHSHSQSFCRK